MAEVFVGTSGWACFFISTEPENPDAIRLLSDSQHGGRRVITTSYVLTELVSLFTSPFRVPRPQQIEWINAIRNASWVEVVFVTPELDEAAWILLKARPDKHWSPVDCASFLVMQQHGITDALTTDHHFEQAGFRSLL